MMETEKIQIDCVFLSTLSPCDGTWGIGKLHNYEYLKYKYSQVKFSMVLEIYSQIHIIIVSLRISGVYFTITQ